MEDMKDILNDELNLKPFPARKNLDKGIDIRRIIRNGFKCQNARDRQSAEAALRATQCLLKNKRLMSNKTKGTKEVMKDVQKNLKKALKSE